MAAIFLVYFRLLLVEDVQAKDNSLLLQLLLYLLVLGEDHADELGAVLQFQGLLSWLALQLVVRLALHDLVLQARGLRVQGLEQAVSDRVTTIRRQL